VALQLRTQPVTSQPWQCSRSETSAGASIPAAGFVPVGVFGLASRNDQSPNTLQKYARLRPMSPPAAAAQFDGNRVGPIPVGSEARFAGRGLLSPRLSNVNDPTASTAAVIVAA
jgi:hypothetical protein